MYDSNWDASVYEDKKASMKGGNRIRRAYKIDTLPVKVHFALPPQPYTHPTTGQPLPFRAGLRHFVSGAGPKGQGAYIECGPECVPCALANPAQFGLSIKPNPRMVKFPPKPYYAVGGYVEEWFHLVEKEKDDKSGTYHDRERCRGRGCKMCTANVQKTFGLKTFFNFAPKHWSDSVYQVHKKLELTMCKCGGSIFVPVYTCRACNAVLVDVCATCECGSEDITIEPDTNVATCDSCNESWSAFIGDHAELFEKVINPCACHECGNKALPQPDKMCSTEGCAVDPYTVFDTQLTLRKADDKNTADLLVTDYAIQEPDPRLFDVKYQGTGEMAEKVAKANSQIYDLDKLLAPLPSSEQARLLGVADPFSSNPDAAAAEAPQYRRYARKAAEA